MLEIGLNGFYEDLFNLLRNCVNPQKYRVKINDKLSTNSSVSSEEHSDGLEIHANRSRSPTPINSEFVGSQSGQVS